MKVDLVEGQTAPVQAYLKADGVAIDMTGRVAGLVLKGSDGVAVTTGGKVTTVTAATGLVQFAPGSSDLVAAKSPYLARWSVTDGAGKVAYFPSGEPDQWVVRK